LRIANSRHIFCDAMPALRQLVISAIKVASPSLESLAAQLKLATSALRRYRLGDREPSADTVRSLAAALRQQASRLVQAADRLDRATIYRRSDA
jgi:transcriptional regulator with XRE-family HTH domain